MSTIYFLYLLSLIITLSINKNCDSLYEILEKQIVMNVHSGL